VTDSESERVSSPPQVLQTRISRDLTVLFIDIKDFTAGCAQMTVAQVHAPSSSAHSLQPTCTVKILK
jgi:hypothetical protein